jgi:hypothetical protein
MPHTKRAWTEEDIAKLKSMAGKMPAKEIAAQLQRSPGAVCVEASKLKIRLRTRSAVPRPRAMPSIPGERSAT